MTLELLSIEISILGIFVGVIIRVEVIFGVVWDENDIFIDNAGWLKKERSKNYYPIINVFNI